VDESRFDALARSLVATHGRRTLLSLIATFGLGGINEALSKKGKKKKKKKKRKRKRKKGHRCNTVGGQVVCPKGSACCDPTLSTGGGCTSPAQPVCCISNHAAYPLGATCCSTSSAGLGGACPAFTHPHCCPFPISGCCIAGASRCCVDPIGPYCCPATSVCCPFTSVTGCCFAREAPNGEGIEEVAIDDVGLGRLAPSRGWMGPPTN
jgi:hypothetical protein